MKAKIEIYNNPYTKKKTVLNYNPETLKLAEHLKKYFNKYFMLYFSTGSKINSEGRAWDSKGYELGFKVIKENKK